MANMKALANRNPWLEDKDGLSLGLFIYSCGILLEFAGLLQ